MGRARGTLASDLAFRDPAAGRRASPVGRRHGHAPDPEVRALSEVVKVACQTIGEP